MGEDGRPQPAPAPPHPGTSLLLPAWPRVYPAMPPSDAHPAMPTQRCPPSACAPSARDTLGLLWEVRNQGMLANTKGVCCRNPCLLQKAASWGGVGWQGMDQHRLKGAGGDRLLWWRSICPQSAALGGREALTGAEVMLKPAGCLHHNDEELQQRQRPCCLRLVEKPAEKPPRDMA